jgi:hypothetical protein
MSTEIIVALVVVVLFIGSLVYLEINSRRTKPKADANDGQEALKREQ